MGREIVSIATALVPYPPERVWAVVTDLDCWQWRSDLSRLDHVGEDAFTEYDRSGFPTRFTVTERRPLSRWAFDLDNANLAGRWAGGIPAGGRRHPGHLHRDHHRKKALDALLWEGLPPPPAGSVSGGPGAGAGTRRRDLKWSAVLPS